MGGAGIPGLNGKPGQAVGGPKVEEGGRGRGSLVPPVPPFPPRFGAWCGTYCYF